MVLLRDRELSISLGVVLLGFILQEHNHFAGLMSSSKETAVLNHWVILRGFSLSEIFIMGRTLQIQNLSKTNLSDYR